MNIATDAIAGSLESSDALVRVSPDEELHIEIKSTVLGQFGDQIRAVVEETLAKLGITRGIVSIDDKGALDFVIRARVQAACVRASGTKADWSAL